MPKRIHFLWVAQVVDAFKLTLDPGTQGFFYQAQIGHEDDRIYNIAASFAKITVFLCCEWKTAWTLLYKPIDEKERIEIDKIVKVSIPLNDFSNIFRNVMVLLSGKQEI